MAAVPSLAEVLDGHVTLDVECFDRLYLNAYVPTLQTPGGTVYFLHDHLGHPIPSPALFRPMGEAFRAAVADFARDADIPVIRFRTGQRKLDVVRPYLDGATGPRGGCHRGGPGGSAGHPGHRRPAQPSHRGPHLLVPPGRSADHGVLLLHLGRRVRPLLHQDVLRKHGDRIDPSERQRRRPEVA